MSIHRRNWMRQFVIGIATVALSTLGVVNVAQAIRPMTVGATLFAYPNGVAAAPTSCPQSALAASQCNLTSALLLLHSGGTVILATAGTSSIATHYVGNFLIGSGAAGVLPVTVETAPTHANAILDGNLGSSTNCPTTSCANSVLVINGGASVHLSGVTIERAVNGLSKCGGGIDNADSSTSTLTITNSQFINNSASGYDGGAIDNGDNGGHGTLTITNSIFSSNTASDGAAIDNGDDNGYGALTVTGSTFNNNVGVLYGGISGGGAIDSGDNKGSGSLTVSNSSFSTNESNQGGAIFVRAGTLSVTTSTFTNNLGNFDGGAIDVNPRSGTIAASVSNSVFSDNNAVDGGAIDVGDHNDFGSLSLIGSTFNSNGATDGGAIDIGDNGSSNASSAQIINSTFAGNEAVVHGGGIDVADNSGLGSVAISGSSFTSNGAAAGAGLRLGPGTSNSTVTRSTFARNLSTSVGLGGGGIADASTAATTTVTNSTFAYNAAIGTDSTGGGVVNHGGGTMIVASSTFLANRAPGLSGSSAWGVVTLAGDIFAQAVGAECAGVMTDAGRNVADDASCTFSAPSSLNSSVIDKYVGALSMNGGPTATVALLASPSSPTTLANPALGTIPASFNLPGTSTKLCSLNDQRGAVRITPCDAGSFALTSSSTALVLSSSVTHLGSEQHEHATVFVTPKVAAISPTGSVKVMSGALVICTIALINGAGNCSFAPSVLALGAHALTAVYSGSLNWSGSKSAPRTLHVVH